MNKSDIVLSYELIKSNFRIEKDIPGGVELSFDWLLNWLADEVGSLMDEDFSAFLNVCYRIDLEEQKVKEILTLESPNAIPRELSRYIIQRQLQKIESRRKYSDREEDG